MSRILFIPARDYIWSVHQSKINNMKCLLCYACLLLAALSGYEASGQIAKGTRFWGGTVEGSGSFFSSKSEQMTQKSQSNKVALKAQWGLFAKPDFMLGLGVQLGLQPFVSKSGESDAYVENINRQYSYSLAPFVRWYKPLTGKISLFVEPALAVGLVHYRHRFTTNISEGSSKADRFQSALTVVPGISYRLGKRFALETDLNILRLGVEYASGDDYREFRFASSVSSGITSYFGLRGAFYLD